MPERSISSPGGSRKIMADLTTAGLRLDLSSEPSSLSDGTASNIEGRDVVRRGRLLRKSRRKKVTVPISDLMKHHFGRNTAAYPTSDVNDSHGITSVIPSGFHGNFTRARTFDTGAVVSETTGVAIHYENATLFNPAAPNRPLDQYTVLQVPDSASASIGGVAPGGFAEGKAIINYGNAVRTVDVVRGALIGNGNDGLRFPDPRNFDIAALDTDGPLGSVYDKIREDTNDGANGWSISTFLTKNYDKRGAWVTNGRRFWLLQGGVYYPYLDVGPDFDTLGRVWRGSQVSPNVFMFVTEGRPPVTISLDQEPLTEEEFAVNLQKSQVEVSKMLAGLLPPRLEETTGDGGMLFSHTSGTDGDTIAGVIGGCSGDWESETDESVNQYVTIGTATGGDAVYRIVCRYVDDDTGATSAFVPIYSNGQDEDPPATILAKSANEDIALGSGAGDRVVYVTSHLNQNQVISGPTSETSDRVYPDENLDERRMPFKSARATHIEFWRTDSSGVSYWLEYRKRLTWPAADFYDRFANFQDATLSTNTSPVLNVTTPGSFALSVGTHAFLNRPDADLQVLSGINGFLTTNKSVSGGIPPAARFITSIEGATILAGASASKVFVTLQSKRIEWPRVPNDEILYVSDIRESSSLQPEGFNASDRLLLSRTGDEFKGIASAGKQAVVVMLRSAYLLRRDFDAVNGKVILVREPLGTGDLGTPWGNTVLSIGKRAMWVTPSGIRIYDPEANQGTGGVSFADNGDMREWFKEAIDRGYDVQAAFDPRYSMIHVRRTQLTPRGNVASADERSDYSESVPAVNEDVELLLGVAPAGGAAAAPIEDEVNYGIVDSASLNMATGEWSLEGPTPGHLYVTSASVEVSGEDKQALYSVDALANVWEENYEGDTQLLNGLLTEGKISGGEVVVHLGGSNEESVSRFSQMVRTGDNDFSDVMEGEFVYFYSEASPELNTYRKAVNAGFAALTLDAAVDGVPDMVFVVGRPRFNVRWAPVIGNSYSTTLTIEGLQVVARPGSRHKFDGTKPKDGLTVRVYTNYGDNPKDAIEGEVGIFDDDDLDGVTFRRESGVQGQGNAIEIEIESTSATDDFVIDAVLLRLREDGDVVSDSSPMA